MVYEKVTEVTLFPTQPHGREPETAEIRRAETVHDLKKAHRRTSAEPTSINRRAIGRSALHPRRSKCNNSTERRSGRGVGASAARGVEDSRG